MMLLSNEWKPVEGFSNMGEDDETIVARRKDDGTVSVGYLAYGGIKLVDLSGVEDVAPIGAREDLFSTIVAECGDDWEVAFVVKGRESTGAVVIDSNSDVAVIGFDDNDVDAAPVVTFSEEYDSDNMEELMDEEEALLRMFNLV